MKPIRKRLEKVREDTGLSWEIIERDYILSWVLIGIGANNELQNKLIFKGGTALKKCYFGEYRFSEDLDFTAKEDIPKESELEKEIMNSCRLATKLVQVFSPLQLKSERYIEKIPHPMGQEAFTVRGKFPWHQQFFVKAMIEITMDEPIIIKPEKKQIIHGYEEKVFQNILVYSLEEIVAEKLRALLQHLQKLEERGWSRSRARDYYDLWMIFNNYPGRLRMEILPDLFLEKCKVRNIDFGGPEDFFNKTLLDYITKTWEKWLGPLVPELPSSKRVIDNLKNNLFNIFKSAK